MKKIVIILIVFAAIAAAAKSGLFSTEPSTEETIARIIKGAESARPRLMRKHARTFKDYQIYKTDDGQGVVYEYTLRNEINLEELGLTAEKVKAQFLAIMRSNKLWPKTKELLKQGIYFHVLYNDPEGYTLMQFKVTGNDV